MPLKQGMTKIGLSWKFQLNTSSRQDTSTYGPSKLDLWAALEI
jgi:hypothetical protein